MFDEVLNTLLSYLRTIAHQWTTEIELSKVWINQRPKTDLEPMIWVL